MNLASEAPGDIAGALANSAKANISLPLEKPALALNLHAALDDIARETAYYCFYFYQFSIHFLFLDCSGTVLELFSDDCRNVVGRLLDCSCVSG